MAKNIFFLDVSQVLSSPLFTIDQTFFMNNKRAISRFFWNSISYYAGFHLFKINGRNSKSTRVRCAMCLKLTVRTPKWRQGHLSGVFIVLTFNVFDTFIWCFHQWTTNYWLSRLIVKLNLFWTRALTSAHLHTSISPPELVILHWLTITN